MREVEVTGMYAFKRGLRMFAKIMSSGGAQVEAVDTHRFVIGDNYEGVRARTLRKGTPLFVLTKEVGAFENRAVVKKESFSHNISSYREESEVFHPKTESENFLVSEDGDNFFLVLNGK